MRKFLLTLLILFSTTVSHADTLTFQYYPIAVTDSITNEKLNSWLQAVSNVVNGGLDNNNASITDGFRFIEIVSSTPAAGNQGRVVFNTADNTLSFDSGSAWIPVAVLANTQTFTGVNTFANLIATTADINGGTLDGVQIGAETATGMLLVNNSSDDADGLGSQGTAGQVLTSAGAGANPTWTTKDMQIVTSDGNFTAPAGITKVYLTMVGGGGGGGGSDGVNDGGGGGGAGAAIINYPYTVTPLSVYAVDIGAGGTAGPINQDGGAGAATYFDTGGGNIGVAGGGGGGGMASGSGGAAGSGAASSDGGATGQTPAGYRFGGGDGGAGVSSTNSGAGGSSVLGVGVAGHTSANTGTAGTANTGVGGSGGYGGNKTGGAGGSGVCIIMY